MSRVPRVRTWAASVPFRERLEPFVKAGVLETLDLEVVDTLAVLGGVHDPDVLLALAFAVRAPRVGAVGVRLEHLPAQLAEEPWRAGPGVRVASLPWPVQLPSWSQRVARSPLVAATTEDGDGARPFVLEHGLLAMHRYARYQRQLAASLRSRLAAERPPIGRARPTDADLAALVMDAAAGLTENQTLAVALVLSRAFTVVSGGPGTGKTFVVRRILEALHAAWTRDGDRPPTVALAAPTGKAAVRMRESLRGSSTGPASAWLEALPATTLHKLLGFQPATPTRYRHDAEHPLPHDVVLVDEASMVDLPMMARVVEATRSDARLVLLGDRDQLASVEVGSVLADITQRIADARRAAYSDTACRTLRALVPEGSAVPVWNGARAAPIRDAIAYFDKSHRFEAGSVVAPLADALRAGDDDTRPLALLSGRAAWDGARVQLHAHAKGSLSSISLDAITSGYAAYLEAVRAARGRADPASWRAVLDALETFRVLAAQRRGPLGVESLNTRIGQRLRGALGERPSLVAGDPWCGLAVLVTENRYDLGRVNGDIGVVADTGEGLRQVVFPGDTAGAVTFLDAARLPAWEPAFALTIHKSQGSQFGHVFLVLPDGDTPLLTRELVYTALTRARRDVSVAGDPEILRLALGRRIARASALGGLLWDEER